MIKSGIVSVSVIVGLPILRLVLVLGKKSANLHVLNGVTQIADRLSLLKAFHDFPSWRGSRRQSQLRSFRHLASHGEEFDIA